MAFLKSKNSEIVMDLGTYGMRLLVLDSASPGDIKLKSLATFSSPREFVVSTFIENPIMDAEPVKKTIKELSAAGRGTSKNVLLMLPDHAALISLMIGTPKYSKKELEEAVKEDFTPIMPLPYEHWHVVHQTVGVWEDEEITLALAIIRQNLIEIGGFVQASGFNIQTVDVNFFNVANLIEHYLTDTENKGRNIGLVHLGNETTSIGVFRDGQIRTFMNRPIGGYDFTKKISKHFHVPESEAEQFKCNEIFFLPEPSPEQDGLYNFTVIKETFSVLTREIFSALESFLTKFREFNIHEIILSGGGANFQNIGVILASNLNAVIRPVSEFYSLSLNGTPLEDSKKNALAPACGAFLRN